MEGRRSSAIIHRQCQGFDRGSPRESDVDPSVASSLSLCGCTAAAAVGCLAACLLATSYGEHRPVRPKPLSMRPPATADIGGRSGRRCCCCWQRSSDRPAHGRQRKAETEERKEWAGGKEGRDGLRHHWGADLAVPSSQPDRRFVRTQILFLLFVLGISTNTVGVSLGS
ncbi:hypothetical protein K456DRAFT_1148805 [Colletotrichum gloeosporioides 23]|nr:hypothetical protein K456DRAFT_1148805 [Colletotrichum gloeosporioides 23]